jgi:hypothetical protein
MANYISNTRCCRFCHAYSDSLLKYATRSYAHHSCYLDAGKKLADLHTWQIQNFPWSVLNARKLLEEAERLVAEREGGGR